MAFDAGAVIGRLELNAAGWQRSIETVKKDQKILQDKVAETSKTVEQFGGKVNVAAGAVGGPGGLTEKWQKLTGAYFAGMAAFAVVNSALSKLRAFTEDCIRGAIEEEKAEKSLQLSLETTGRTVAGNLRHYLDYAMQLHNVTLFTHEQVQASQALLLQLTNLDQQGIDAATRGAIGLATTFRIDLQSATMLVAKAMEGNFGALGRYGIKVAENLPLEQKRIELLKQLSGMYERAKGETDTFGGALTQLKKSYDELKEAIGTAITKSTDFKGILELLKIVIDNVAASLSGQGKSVDIFSLSIKAAFDLLKNQFGPVLLWAAVEGEKHEYMIRQATKAYEALVPTLKSVDEWLLKHGIDISFVTTAWNRKKEAINEVGNVLPPVGNAVKESIKLEETWTTVIRGNTAAILENAKWIDTWLGELPDLRKSAKYNFIDTLSTMRIVSEDEGEKIRRNMGEIVSSIAQSFNWLGDELGGIWGKIFSTAASVLDQIGTILKDKTKSWGDAFKSIGPVLAGQLGAAIGGAISGSTKNFGAVGSALGAAIGSIIPGIGTALGAAVGGLFGGLFGKKEKKTEEQRLLEQFNMQVKEAIATLSEYGKISETTAKAIAEDRKQMEGYAAISKNFASVIKDVGVNQKNVNELWVRMGDIIQHIQTGALDTQEGIKALGESFNLMVEGARKLGAEGGQGMVDFIKKLRAAGMEVPEVTQYIISELEKIPAALGTIVSNIYIPPESIDILKKRMTDLVNQISKVKIGSTEWENLNKEIQKTHDSLVDIEKKTPSTQKALDDMGRIASASFQAMLANGKTFLEALTAMDGPLQAMADRYKTMGLAIPDFLKPLLNMEALSKKFPAVFSNMSAGLQILNSLRNSAYLTQDTFNSLMGVVEKFAHTILGTAGSLSKFMNTAKLTQTQIQALLPIVSQFVGAAAIFGLAIPNWMKGFVTKQLGVDWSKFVEASKAMSSSGIATVEALQKQIDNAKTYDTNSKQRLKELGDRFKDFIGTHGNRMEQYFSDLNKVIVGAIGGLPHAAGGALVMQPSLIYAGEVPEFVAPIMDLDRMASNLGRGIRTGSRSLTFQSNIVFNMNSLDSKTMKQTVQREIIPIITETIKGNIYEAKSKLSKALELA